MMLKFGDILGVVVFVGVILTMFALFTDIPLGAAKEWVLVGISTVMLYLAYRLKSSKPNKGK